LTTLKMTKFIKEAVSKKKIRYVKGRFNLDLTYINSRVIAMGFPSENVEAIYRNSMDDVREMLEEEHKDHYKIYNLCSERSYDISKFHSRVAVYPFDDHNPPEFGQMRPFCEDVSKWLDEHEDNVAVVHCKAGKGRTGLMICAYLLHSGTKTSANEVLEYYASTRTQDSKGVTIPSQRRYVDYYATLINDRLQYNPVKMYLTSIVIDALPQMGMGGHEGHIQFEIRQTSVRPYVSEVYQTRRSDGMINLLLPQPLLIVGDIKIEFIQKLKLDILNLGQRLKQTNQTGRLGQNLDHFEEKMSKYWPRYVDKKNLFHFWVNTFFIDQQRTSTLTHSSDLAAPAHRPSPPAANPSNAGKRGWPPEDRGCRSNHPSGGTLGPDSPLPNPRVLRQTLSSGDSRTSDTDPVSQGSSEDQSEDHSPNGSCVASVQTIHSHPPAKTVSIVDHYNQVGPNAENCDRMAVDVGDGKKPISSSDDSIIRTSDTEGGSSNVYSTTHQSFLQRRQRHSSVPQTSAQGVSVQTKSKRNIPAGRLMSVQLNKSQIDKASKNKSGKFSENFKVTLFLVRPNDQTLQAEFSRSNLICQRGLGGGDNELRPHESSEESEEEETAELRRRNPTSDSQSDTTSHLSYHSAGDTCAAARHVTTHDVLPALRTRSANLHSLHGMVRNSSEPQQRLSEMTLSQSTWI